jgi:hypothetical protein
LTANEVASFERHDHLVESSNNFSRQRAALQNTRTDLTAGRQIRSPIQTGELPIWETGGRKMQIPREAVLLRIFFGENDRYHRLPLHEAIVLKAREMHLGGATSWSNFHLHGFILRDASLRDAPQDEVSDPHGEERGCARLEPRGLGKGNNDSSEPENAIERAVHLELISFAGP